MFLLHSTKGNPALQAPPVKLCRCSAVSPCPAAQKCIPGRRYDVSFSSGLCGCCGGTSVDGDCISWDRSELRDISASFRGRSEGLTPAGEPRMSGRAFLRPVLPEDAKSSTGSTSVMLSLRSSEMGWLWLSKFPGAPLAWGRLPGVGSSPPDVLQPGERFHQENPGLSPGATGPHHTATQRSPGSPRFQAPLPRCLDVAFSASQSKVPKPLNAAGAVGPDRNKPRAAQAAVLPWQESKRSEA